MESDLMMTIDNFEQAMTVATALSSTTSVLNIKFVHWSWLINPSADLNDRRNYARLTLIFTIHALLMQSFHFKTKNIKIISLYIYIYINAP